MVLTLKGASSNWPPCGNVLGETEIAWSELEVSVHHDPEAECSHHESPQGHIEVRLLRCVVHAV